MKTKIEVKRKLAPLQLTHSPLILALAQVMMTPVMKMESFVPDIQERLRRSGYPKMRKRIIRTEAQDPQGNTLQIEERSDWEFVSKGDQVSLVVGTHGVVMATSDYRSFDEFAGQLEDCLNIVHDVVSISGVDRLGLRYIDLIEPTPEKPLSHYLSSQILGLDLDGLGARLANMSETVLKTGDHQKLVLRCIERPKGVVLPPDMLPIGLKLKRELTSKTSFGILDSDHYVEFPLEPMEFGTAEVLNRLGELHEALDQSFRKAVTPVAIEKEWK